MWTRNRQGRALEFQFLRKKRKMIKSWEINPNYDFIYIIKEIMIFMNINVRKSKLFFYNSKNFKV